MRRLALLFTLLFLPALPGWSNPLVSRLLLPTITVGNSGNAATCTNSSGCNLSSGNFDGVTYGTTAGHPMVGVAFVSGVSTTISGIDITVSGTPTPDSSWVQDKTACTGANCFFVFHTPAAAYTGTAVEAVITNCGGSNCARGFYLYDLTTT